MTEPLDLPIAFTWPRTPPKNEKALRQRFVKRFTAEHPGAWIYCPREIFRCGIPDFLAVIHGHAVALEFKMEGNKPTPIQIATIKDLSDAGAWARFVVQMKDGVVRSFKHDELIDKDI